MATADNISLLRRKRGQQIGKLTTLSKRLDEYEQAGQHKEPILLTYETQLNDAWKQFTSIQEEIERLDEEESERFHDVYNQQLGLTARLQYLIKEAQPASS
jgi:hypothetical protein